MIPNRSHLVKHKSIFIYYQMFLKANPQAARKWPKKRIYIEISRPFYLEAQAVSKIVSKLTIAHYTPSRIDIEDFNRAFGEVENIRKMINA